MARATRYHTAMRPDLSPRTPSDPGQRSGRKATRLLPLLIIGGILVAIAAQEIPAVGTWLQRWLQPEHWQASQTCQTAALALAGRREFARVIAPGKVHATQEGFYIEALVIGEMAENGGESRFSVACYTDSAGRLVRADRIEALTP